MSSTVFKAVIQARMTITETTGDAPTGVTAPSIITADPGSILNATTGDVLAKRLASYKTTFSGGSYAVDLTAAQGTNGTVNGSTMTVVGLVVDNSDYTHDVTIAPGVSNGYDINGGDPLVVPAGGYAMLFFAVGLPAIGGSAKSLSVGGTDGDAPLVLILMG